MANFLTNLLFEPKGKHDPNKTYTIKDTVMSADASKVYFALQDVPAGISLTNTDYWILQMDLSASKNAMDTAASNARTQTDATIASANTRVEDMMGKAADAVTSVADYAAKVGMRVKGETKITKGNPMTIYPDGGSLLKAQTDIPIKQAGSGDPYPAGGGRNKLVPNVNYGTKNGIEFTKNADGSWTVKGTSTAANAFFNLNYVNNTTSLIPPGDYIVSGGSSKVNVQVAVNGIVEYESAGGHVPFTISETTPNCWVRLQVPNSGTTVDETVYPMVRLATDNDKFYAPPSNIRPITGYDKLELNAAGKNLLPDLRTSFSATGITFTKNADGSWHISGTATATTSIALLLNTDKVSYVSGRYTVSLGTALPSGVSSRVEAYDKTTLKWFKTYGNIPTASGMYTIDILGDYYTTMLVAINSGTAVDFTIYPMIRLASDVDATYKPYRGNTYTVQIGQTVYGGRFDWLTGKLTLTHKYVEYGGDTVFYSPNTGLINNGGIIRVTPILNPVGHSKWGEQEVFSNLLPHVEGGWNNSDTSGPHLYILNEYPDTLVLLLPTSIYGTTEASVKAKLAETPLQVVYKLATPIEMQLAPNVITATEDGGMNHIYGDADLTVEWVKPLETSLTEHSNAKVDASNEALLADIAQKERSIGNPISIKDAVANVAFQHVETIFTPKQAGSGDPCPTGSGKNLLPTTASTTTIQGITHTVNSDGTIGVKGTSETENASFKIGEVILPAGDYIVSGAAGDSQLWVYGNDTRIQTNDSRFSLTEATLVRCNLYVRKGVSYNVVISPMIRLASIADDTYAPYSNIRPITGYDALGLNHTGKNLAPRFASETKNGVTLTAYDDGSVSLTGTYTATSGFIAYYDVPLPPGTYTISANNPEPATDEGLFIAVYDETSTIIQAINMLTVNRVYKLTTEKTIKQIRIRGPVGLKVDNFIVKLQVENGSVSSEFVKPQSDLYTVQIGQTVYGGRFDWLTGKLTAEYGFITLTGNEAYTFSGGKDLLLALQDAPEPIPGGVEAWCSHYKRTLSTTAAGILDCEFTVSHKSISGIPRLCIRDSVHFTDLSSGQAYIAAQHAAGTPVQIAYKLATPIEIQLDSTRITTIPGINTIFGDGEFTIDWFKSYKKVAEERENLLLDSFTDKAELTGNPITMSPVGGLPFDSVVTEFSPKQAGSGDPYPAGGGKNLAPIFANETKGGMTLTAYSDGSVSLTGTYTDSDAFSFRGEYETPLPPGTYTISVNNPDAITASGFWIAPYDDTVTIIKSIHMSETNAVYTLTTDVPIKQIRIRGTRDVALNNFIIKLQVETGSVATEYAPPSNIRPITGYDKLNLNRTGKNLIPYYNLLSGYSDGGVTVTINADKTLTFSGTATRDAYFYLSIYSSTYTTGYVFPPGEYALSGCPAGGGTQSYRMALSLYKDGVWQEGGCTDYGSGGRFTIPEGHKVDLYIRFPSGTNANGVIFKPMIRLSSVDDTNYEPNQDRLHTVQIGQTVYGGKFNWLTGKLVADKKLITLTGEDGAKLTSTSTNTSTYFYASRIAEDCMKHDNYKEPPYGISSHFKVGVWNSGNMNEFGVSPTGGVGIYYNGTRDEANEWLAAQNAAGTPVQFALNLLEPIEIQLTPTEICTLSGVNTLYGDGDTIKAKFRQSKTISLEERLSALEAVFLNQ